MEVTLLTNGESMANSLVTLTLLEEILSQAKPSNAFAMILSMKILNVFKRKPLTGKNGPKFRHLALLFLHLGAHLIPLIHHQVQLREALAPRLLKKRQDTNKRLRRLLNNKKKREQEFKMRLVLDKSQRKFTSAVLRRQLSKRQSSGIKLKLPKRRQS